MPPVHLTPHQHFGALIPLACRWYRDVANHHALRTQVDALKSAFMFLRPGGSTGVIIRADEYHSGARLEVVR